MENNRMIKVVNVKEKEISTLGVFFLLREFDELELFLRRKKWVDLDPWELAQRLTRSLTLELKAKDDFPSWFYDYVPLYRWNWREYPFLVLTPYDHNYLLLLSAAVETNILSYGTLVREYWRLLQERDEEFQVEILETIMESGLQVSRLMLVNAIFLSYMMDSDDDESVEKKIRFFILKEKVNQILCN